MPGAVENKKDTIKVPLVSQLASALTMVSFSKKCIIFFFSVKKNMHFYTIRSASNANVLSADKLSRLILLVE